MRKEWTWIVASCVLLVMVVSMLNAPRVDATLASKPVPAGSWWTNAGTYSWELSGTGHYSGKYREDGTYIEKYTVVSSGDSTMVISYSETGSWTCTAAGEWASTCQPNTGTYSSQTDYTIDSTTLKVTAAYDASSPESIKEEVGHPTWILLATDLSVGDAASQWWRVPRGTSSNITDVLWKVERLQEINVRGVDVTARVLTYTGGRLGYLFWVRSDGQELRSEGLMTESALYDTVYGILMGHIRTGVYTHADSDASGGSILYSEGSWTETQQDSSQITDTNLEFEFKPPQVSVTLGSPAANVPVTVDGASYAGDQLPKIFSWDAGSTHTLRVEAMIQGGPGIRYIFVQWSDGSKDASRSITATESTNLVATFRAQYELKVISYLGDPQGSGWYDAGSIVTFSVTSPQPEIGLFGSLGGKTVFQAWTGDSKADTSTADIVMESPKTVRAQWITDDSQPYMILGGIGVGVVVVIMLALLLMRRKKLPSPVYPPAQARAPPPPPPDAQVPFCKNCGRPTTYIAQYQRYYCYNCQQYD